MNAQDTQFFELCPAWARKLGVRNLEVWKLIEKLFSFDWPDRFDCIHAPFENGGFVSMEDAKIAERVLREWDDIVAEQKDPDDYQISHN